MRSAALVADLMPAPPLDPKLFDSGFHAPATGWARSLLEYAAHSVRRADIDRGLVTEILTRIAQTGTVLSKGRNAAPSLFHAIATIEMAEAQGRISKEQAEWMLEWLYYTRDTLGA